MHKYIKQQRRKFKLRLEDTEDTIQYLKSLSKLYVLVHWAKCAVLECYYSGYTDENGIPYIYYYNDVNGLDPHYNLIPITRITSGSIYAWTTNRLQAENLREYLNNKSI